jgi:hypothetical protein
VSGFLYANDKDDITYFHDVSIDIGVYPFINKLDQPDLFGNVTSIQNVNYLTEHAGFRTGFSVINNLEGSNGLYSVPIYFAYRTSTQREFTLGNVTSPGELIFGIILGLLPRNYEFNIGLNTGYIAKDESKSYLLIGNKKYLNSYTVDNCFYSSIDGGIRLNYKIWHFGLVFAPGLSYMMTRNFTFESTLPNDNNKGLRPSLYFKFTGGLSFRF